MHHGKCQDCGENCASCDDGEGFCNQCCHPSFILSRRKYDCECQWGFEPSKDGNSCVPKPECRRGQYRDYFTDTCKECGEDCLSCADKWGQCIECRDSTYENHFFTCACPKGYIKTPNGCASDCPVGMFADYHRDNQCSSCGENCARCDDLWGFCLECIHPSFCMNKRTCSCLDGQMIEKGKCV